MGNPSYTRSWVYVMLIHIWPKPETISKVIIHSSRQYGQPRLKKPKELHGIKRAFSVDWIYKKCRCQCFVLDNDIYIKHRDFDSIPLYTLTDEDETRLGIKRKEKFIYKDNWGCVVLRGEAWIILKDVIIDIRNDVFPVRIVQSLAEQITGEIGCHEWERFFERALWGYGKWKKDTVKK